MSYRPGRTIEFRGIPVFASEGPSDGSTDNNNRPRSNRRKGNNNRKTAEQIQKLNQKKDMRMAKLKDDFEKGVETVSFCVWTYKTYPPHDTISVTKNDNNAKKVKFNRTEDNVKVLQGSEKEQYINSWKDNARKHPYEMRRLVNTVRVIQEYDNGNTTPRFLNNTIYLFVNLYDNNNVTVKLRETDTINRYFQHHYHIYKKMKIIQFYTQQIEEMHTRDVRYSEQYEEALKQLNENNGGKGNLLGRASVFRM